MRQRTPAVRMTKASPDEAAAQAAWIVEEEPWRSLGYERRRLCAWMRRCARTGGVRLARTGDETVGVLVSRPDFLLGVFVALLAVRPAAQGQGFGRRLMEDCAARLGRRRWLYASSDSANRRAARFYRGLGFERVGLLRDLLRPGRNEILWRASRLVVGGASAAAPGRDAPGAAPEGKATRGSGRSRREREPRQPGPGVPRGAAAPKASGR